MAVSDSLMVPQQSIILFCRWPDLIMGSVKMVGFHASVTHHFNTSCISSSSSTARSESERWWQLKCPQ